MASGEKNAQNQENNSVGIQAINKNAYVNFVNEFCRKNRKIGGKRATILASRIWHELTMEEQALYEGKDKKVPSTKRRGAKSGKKVANLSPVPKDSLLLRRCKAPQPSELPSTSAQSSESISTQNINYSSTTVAPTIDYSTTVAPTIDDSTTVAPTSDNSGTLDTLSSDSTERTDYYELRPVKYRRPNENPLAGRFFMYQRSTANQMTSPDRRESKPHCSYQNKSSSSRAARSAPCSPKGKRHQKKSHAGNAYHYPDCPASKPRTKKPSSPAGASKRNRSRRHNKHQPDCPCYDDSTDRSSLASFESDETDTSSDTETDYADIFSRIP